MPTGKDSKKGNRTKGPAVSKPVPPPKQPKRGANQSRTPLHYKIDRSSEAPPFTLDDIRDVINRSGLKLSISMAQASALIYTKLPRWSSRTILPTVNATEVKGLLDKLHKRVSSLSDLLIRDERTAHLAGTALNRYYGEVGFKALKKQVKKLEENVADALQVWSNPPYHTKGRNPDIALWLIIATLAAWYRHATGKRPGVSFGQKTKDGIFAGPFFRLCYHTLTLLDGKPPNQEALRKTILRYKKKPLHLETWWAWKPLEDCPPSGG